MEASKLYDSGIRPDAAPNRPERPRRVAASRIEPRVKTLGMKGIYFGSRPEGAPPVLAVDKFQLNSI